MYGSLETFPGRAIGGQIHGHCSESWLHHKWNQPKKGIDKGPINVSDGKYDS